MAKGKINVSVENIFPLIKKEMRLIPVPRLVINIFAVMLKF